MSDFISEINAVSFDDLLKKEFSLLYVTAAWCGPCKTFSPIVAEVAANYNQKISFYKMDADVSSKKSEELNIKSIPTVIIFKNGVEVERFSGVKSRQFLISFIDKHSTFSTNEEF